MPRFNISQKKYAIIVSLFLIILSFHPNSYSDRQNPGDEAVRKLNSNYNYQRIITLAPNLTGICLKLGLGDRLIGASTSEDMIIPNGITKLDGWQVDFEKILLLKPDVIFTTRAGNRPETIAKLKALHLNIFETSQDNIEGILNTIWMIGSVTSNYDKAVNLARGLNDEIKKIGDQWNGKKRPTVLYLLWHEPIMTTGPNTFISEMVRAAGGEHIFGEEKGELLYPSLEQIMIRNPDVIFLPLNVEVSSLDSRWQKLKAFRQGRIYKINESLVLQPGINVVNGIKLLAEKIHANGNNGGK
ncbi:MAG: ABC transporter substrate-binding protein [Acidobacteria bacterium]|nr:ABC transporter substrate-binding protein [Acidobacteriota bacterium]